MIVIGREEQNDTIYYVLAAVLIGLFFWYVNNQNQVQVAQVPQTNVLVESESSDLFWSHVADTCRGCAQWRSYIDAQVQRYPTVPNLREALVAISWKETNGEFYHEDGTPKVGAAQEYCATQIISNENSKFPNRPSPDWLMNPTNCYTWTADTIVTNYRKNNDWHYAFWAWNGLNDAGRRYADDVVDKFDGLVQAAGQQKTVNGVASVALPHVIERPSATYSSRPSGTTIDTVVLHATVGGLQSSLNTLTKRGTGVSSHYLVAKDGTIYYLVDEEKRAWHAGVSQMPGDDRRNVNDFSIGIEIVNANNGRDPYPPEQVQAVADLVRSIVSRHNVPPENIVTHAQISGKFTGKSDPRGLDVEAIKRYAYGRVS